MCAKGARSPLAPSEPWRGIIGWTPRSSMRNSSSMTSGRQPEWPLANVLARISIMARTTGVSSGRPTPTAWLMTMLRCSWAVCSGSMKRLQKAPKPVVMP